MPYSDYPILQAEIGSVWDVSSTLCWQAKTQLWHRVFKPPSLSINPKVKGVSHIYKFTSRFHSQSSSVVLEVTSTIFVFGENILNARKRKSNQNQLTRQKSGNTKKQRQQIFARKKTSKRVKIVYLHFGVSLRPKFFRK